MNKFIINLITILTTVSTQAQVDTLALKEAVQSGLKNNYAIQIEEQNLAIDENNVSRGNAGFFPSMNLNATQTNNTTNTSREFISGETIDRKGANSQSFNARAELRWTLFDGFRMFTTYNQLKEIRKKGEEQFQLTVLSNVSSIIDQYFTIVRLRQEMATQQEALVLSRSKRNLAKTSYEIGSGSKLDYMQARVDYNTDTSEYITQQEALQAAKIRLNELLGREVASDYKVRPEIPLQEGLEYEALKQYTLTNNPGLKIAQKDKRIANLNLQNVQSEHYPKVGVNIGYNFARSSSEAGFVSESQEHGPDYGFFLSYNLFDGFNTNRKKTNAQLAIDKSKLAYKQKRQQVLSDLRVAFTNYQNNLSKVALERENVQVARENYDIARENYKVGGVAYFELQEAQQNYLDAQNRLTEAKYQTKQAEIELMEVSGMMMDNRGMAD